MSTVFPFFAITGFKLSESGNPTPIHPCGFYEYEDALIERARFQFNDIQKYCKVVSDVAIRFKDHIVSCNPIVIAMLDGGTATRKFLMKFQENINDIHKVMAASVSYNICKICGFNVNESLALTTENQICLLTDEYGTVLVINESYDQGKLSQEKFENSFLFQLKEIVEASPTLDVLYL